MYSSHCLPSLSIYLIASNHKQGKYIIYQLDNQENTSYALRVLHKISEINFLVKLKIVCYNIIYDKIY